MALRQQGRLFLRGHGDCFIHATTSWLNYSNFTLSEDPIVVVRMIYTNGDEEKDLLVTVSPTPIPYENVKKGVNHRKYLEIDYYFARELSIKEDTMVVLESVREVEKCEAITIAPVLLADYDKLVNNSEKIEHELSEKIRVVSCSSFTFPVWINNFTVPVKVVRTEPSAKWVKLMPDRTKLELCESPFTPSTQNTASTSLISPNSDQMSSISPDSDGKSTTSSKQTTSSLKTWDFVNNFPIPNSRPRGSSSNASTASSVDPDSDSDNLNFSFTSFIESAKRYLPLFTQAQARACAPQQDGLVSPEEQEDAFEQVSKNVTEKRILGPPITLSDVSKVPLTEQPPKKPTKALLNEIKDKVPVFDPPAAKWSKKQSGGGTNVLTTRTVPPMHYGAGGGRQTENKVTAPRKSSTSGGDEEKTSRPKHRRSNTWDPSSSFRIKRELSVSPRLNICVRVQPHSLLGMSCKTEIHTIWSERNGVWNHERAFDVFVHPSTIPEVYTFVSSNNLRGRAILLELVPLEHEQMQQQEVNTSDYEDLEHLKNRQNQPKPKRPENVLLPKSLVVRLFFATKLQIQNGKIEASIHESNERKSKEQPPLTDGTQEEVPIQVGHIVTSDAVRQQLRVKVCSRVELRGIRESNRVNSRGRTIALQPITEKGMTVDFIEVKRRFSEWVSELCEVDSIGCALVDKQIIPLFTNKGEPVNVRIAVRNPPNKKPEEALLSYYLLKPADVNRNLVGVELPPKEITTMEKLSDIRELNQTIIEETPDHFGALNVALEEGRQYIDRVFFESRKSGVLLVCGSQGSSAGCGKTSLAKILCKGATGHPYYANVAVVDCTFMRGQSTHRVKKRLKNYFREAVFHQPSVLLLDDLDHCMPVFEDAQEMVGEEGTASIKKAQVLLDLIHEVRIKDDHVLIMVTSQSRQTLNKLLMQSRGEHIFNKCIEIGPPNLADRVAILNAILKSKNQLKLHNLQLRKIALRTEGFQSSDLATLVDRAISKSELRTICPTSFPSLSSWSRLSSDSFEGDSLELVTASSPSTVSLSGSPPKFPSSWKKSNYKTKLPIEATKSNELSPRLDSYRKLKKISMDSTVTLKADYSIDELAGGSQRSVPELRKVNSLSRMVLTTHDFYDALEGFVPVSLRGLPLHSSGTIDFSDVGGMKDAKRTLTETLFWPSKYPKLFSQCPIKQRCGVLLYGAPGTGKTLLAGAVAKEFALNFVSIKGPELLSKYIGASEQAVRDIFTRALSAKPCILFFDEFDSLAPRRGHDNTGVTDRVVNQLLTQLDGVEALQGVYVLAASSRPDLIDPALLRPGRIDRNIFCAMPEQADRLEILEAQKRGIPLDSSVDLSIIADKTVGYTGADLKALLYNAQLKVAHKALDSMNSTREGSPDVDVVSRSSSQSGASGTLDTSGIGSSLISDRPKRRSPLVFKSLGSGRVEQPQLTHSLESKATVLREKQLLRAATDRSLKLKLKTVSERPSTLRATAGTSTITQEDLLAALDEVKPSVSESERRKYDQIYEKFIGKTKVTVADITPTATMA